ncbi:family 43 glycosylhydrolase [Bifidobacterium sp. ESL0704]|uniref:family 43 glycosylhydrolase n=1 Tax=Bifidobacterium sp. ESL0704 TaxID=2983219 RepID=UPI0023F7D7B6|nr:family 43 glycosylhydrolase [Bifidobacterium sp. ESL0704]WEV53084.1 family 43 glycosylhydrolase [Bifidobacterium sp. ESL0704]
MQDKMSDSHRYSLLCYTRKPTGREHANNADVALSMHLALRSPVTGRWEPLNGNYGIFFAAGVPRAGVPQAARGAATASRRFRPEAGPVGYVPSGAVKLDALMPDVDITLKSLVDPYLFRWSDAGYGIAATRTARGGAADGSERCSFLLARSPDLLNYEQLGMVTLDTDEGVHRPQVAALADAGGYAISWYDDGGRWRTAHVGDLLDALDGVVAVDEAVSVGGVGGLQDEGGCEKAGYQGGQAGSVDIADCVPGNVIDIDVDDAIALSDRFGRIYNTGVACPALTFVPAEGKVYGGTRTHEDGLQEESAGVCVDGHVRKAAPDAERRSREALPPSSSDALDDALQQFRRQTVDLLYSDGSDSTRKVDWDEAQLAQFRRNALAGNFKPGQVVTIDGVVRQQTYPVPFARERADPSVFPYDFNGERLFLFIATDDTDGNCIDPNGGQTHMPLRVGRTIAELSDAAGGREREIDLLKRGDRNSEGREMTGCFWAPELHIIGGRLSILFMPCFDGPERKADGTVNDRAGKPDMWTGSCHIMQLGQDGDGRDLDPREPANWDAPRPIRGPQGEELNPVQGISLDMTVFADSGRWYYAWQQIGSVWIASFDPADPTRLTSSPRQIVVPEFAWDNAIAEGPNVVEHDGTLWLIYSGSLVGIDYTTGLATAPAGVGADLLDPQTWNKLGCPLQKSGIYNNEWQLGTGHGMWSADEDGNPLYVFHAAEYANGRYGGRDAQVRRVHWGVDGMPILDMQKSEELDDASTCISMKITVA